MSCKRDEKTFDQGYGYYPLTINHYKIYNVQKISYSILDTIYENYQIKEIITDTFTQGGRLKYRLERFKRNSASDAWPFTPDSVWTVFLGESKLVKTESNVPYIKLVFPVEKGVSWNGNGENAKGKDDYEYEWKEKNYTVNNHYFANTISVLQSPNDSNKVKKDYRKEVFADGVGLIYKIKETYDYQQKDGAAVPGYKIDNGIKYYERIESYGQE